MWPQREQRLLAYLATSPPNECPTIITDSTAGTSLYKPRIASTAWFRNSAWRTSWMAHNETEATQMGAQACKESHSLPHSRPRPRPQILVLNSPAAHATIATPDGHRKVCTHTTIMFLTQEHPSQARYTSGTNATNRHVYLKPNTTTKAKYGPAPRLALLVARQPVGARAGQTAASQAHCCVATLSRGAYLSPDQRAVHGGRFLQQVKRENVQPSPGARNFHLRGLRPERTRLGSSSSSSSKRKLPSFRLGKPRSLTKQRPS